MYIYTFVYGLIVILLKKRGFEIGKDFSLNNIFIMPIKDGHQFYYNMGGWFLVPHFMVQVFNVMVRKLAGKIKSNNKEWFIYAFYLLLGIGGNQLAGMGYYSDWWRVLVRMLYFLPFYGLGILFKNKLEIYDRKIPTFWYMVVVFTIKLIIIYKFGRSPQYSAAWCNNFNEGPIMPIIIGVLGIALWMRIANVVTPVIGKSKWINLIADNTYSIMMNQFMGFMLVKAFYAFMNKNFSLFSGFDWDAYKTDIFYFYTPNGIGHSLIFYTVAGIAVPIIIQKIIDYIKNKVKLIFVRKSENQAMIEN